MPNKRFLLLRNENVKHVLRPCVLAIGNFDGVHLGHQHIIAQVVQQAKQCNLVPAVLTFEPLPLKILRPQQALLRLTSFRQKLIFLRKLGIEQVMCLRFNQQVAKLSPNVFIERYLVDFLKVRYLMVGEDFRFGYQQQGNIALLQERGQQFDFITTPLAILHDQSEKISSTLIRQALIQGDLATVKARLGRNFQLTARVRHGAKRGQQLGFCTANLPLDHGGGLFKGVFVTKVTIAQKIWFGVTNVGTRPTVDGKSYLSETHILDFSDDIYGKEITVEFIHKLRDEQKFSDLAALRTQIANDIVKAQDFIKKTMTLRYPEYEQSGI